jgi:hypothetical protein
MTFFFVRASIALRDYPESLSLYQTEIASLKVPLRKVAGEPTAHASGNILLKRDHDFRCVADSILNSYNIPFLNI